ncbi:HAD-IA family hydrolase [Caulobacter endophyticus]|uniref:HAD-IA family hydrolase n=1 Tax=Caulobacter endophyticus TaxID=2172652 RepID=UPI00240EFBF3|nr:HAD-IA family hydrolase [Caulobacter endophyticus]MDG2528621.1 HAD-IA family hydrolase [Caulobacter endophyticus]
MSDRSPPTFRGKTYAAFLFDMDGTLLDSSPVVERVWTAWAGRHGHDPAEVLAVCQGLQYRDTLRRFAGPDLDIEAEAAALLQAELDDVEGVVALAGVKTLIEGLDPTCWAIVTSAPRALAETRLRAVGLPVPEHFITGESVRNGKPHPEGFLKGAELLGAPIADCLAFEDSPAGVAAARASGAHVAIVGPLVAPCDGDLAIVDYL